MAWEFGGTAYRGQMAHSLTKSPIFIVLPFSESSRVVIFPSINKMSASEEVGTLTDPFALYP